ncbi:uncharacterized protein MYCFIDRAFT_169626 [Pseudocercospora fijiensis CIRAD86]|uniref:Uncharacterized protein n=1 Tax=Pseudocercospora fijiensis (strain CIRAD86) TaxID=383855 RepID=N1Q6E7_PSEFD|nr:uncharacterized protein MYCFIDRAFT_169626 [Pseudocercospora fijiensis CIRAD86]EME87894.1 hypothetical protein MYCFIDRAFT_169626 [Pseudocercospora fijiensis CIRAD86]
MATPEYLTPVSTVRSRSAPPSRMKRQPSKRLSILTTGSLRDEGSEKYFENCLRDHNDYDQANGISNDAILRARLSKIQSPRSFFKVPDPIVFPIPAERPKQSWWRQRLKLMSSCFRKFQTREDEKWEVLIFDFHRYRLQTNWRARSVGGIQALRLTYFLRPETSMILGRVAIGLGATYYSCHDRPFTLCHTLHISNYRCAPAVCADYQWTLAHALQALMVPLLRRFMVSSSDERTLPHVREWSCRYPWLLAVKVARQRRPHHRWQPRYWNIDPQMTINR